MRCLQVRVDRDGREPLKAQFGGISLIRHPGAMLDDTPPVYRNRRTELLTRLLANRCELCGAEEDIQVHHIRKLGDLTGKGGRERPPWVKRMTALQRKTLVVCHGCHRAIHTGRPRDLDTRNEQLESGVPGNRHAPFGGRRMEKGAERTSPAAYPTRLISSRSSSEACTAAPT